MLRKVLKPLTADGKVLQVGSVVDISTWRNAKTLEQMRYLAPLTEAETAKAKKPREVAKPPVK